MLSGSAELHRIWLLYVLCNLCEAGTSCGLWWYRAADVVKSARLRAYSATKGFARAKRTVFHQWSTPMPLAAAKLHFFYTVQRPWGPDFTAPQRSFHCTATVVSEPTRRDTAFGSGHRHFLMFLLLAATKIDCGCSLRAIPNVGIKLRNLAIARLASRCSGTSKNAISAKSHFGIFDFRGFGNLQISFWATLPTTWLLSAMVTARWRMMSSTSAAMMLWSIICSLAAEL